MKNCAKAIFVIIGTIIGAGFASGQEIYSFFNIYGENGIIGITIASSILGVVIFNVLKKANKLNINTYMELLKSTKISNRLIQIINIVINIFLLISFYIMVAGFVAYFKQEFNVPNILTAILVLIIAYMTFMRNIEGIAKINSVIIPVLIFIVFIIGYKVDIFSSINNIDMENIQIKTNWILRSIEYAGYNSILLIPILISIKDYTKNNEKKISIITTGIFFILSIIIYFAMFKFKEVGSIEIPLIYIASKYGFIFKYTYGLVIIFAIYTTMISAGYGFLKNCTKSDKQYKLFATIICITAIFISNFSFSGLVNLTYPVFGILGTIKLFFLLRY